MSSDRVRPKKQLGQHFLRDLSVAERIADTLPLDTAPLPVLEVGPGMGVLTQFLLRRPSIDLHVVELDSESVAYLTAHFPMLRGRIIEGDFLRLPLENLFPDRFYIIGNYPYNISSQIFFRLLDYRDRVPVLSGMVQREVAERIAAPPGSKTYGILSVLLQAYFSVEYLFTVPPGVFNPPPKVQSAVLRLTRNSRATLPCDDALFRRVVKTAFGQRRKTLRNSLRPMLTPSMSAADAVFDLRPEQLSVDDFIALTLRFQG